MGQQLKTDWILFGTVLAMVAFGLLILYSASSITAAVKPAETGAASVEPHFESSLHIVSRQLGWAVVAVARDDGAEAHRLSALPESRGGLRRHRRGADAADRGVLPGCDAATAGCG